MCYVILTRVSFPCLCCQKLIDAKLYELLGERTAADNEKPSKQKKEKPAKVEVSEFHACYIYHRVIKSSDCFPFLILCIMFLCRIKKLLMKTQYNQQKILIHS